MRAYPQKWGHRHRWVHPKADRPRRAYHNSVIVLSAGQVQGGAFSLTPFIRPKIVEKNTLNFEGIETRSILSRLHRSVQSVRLTPSPLVSMLTRFCVGVVSLTDTLVYRVGIRYRSPINGGIGRCVTKRYTPTHSRGDSRPQYSRMI